MKRSSKIMGVFLLLSLAGTVVMADWDIGDSHKMHYPQLPKVEGGWDVMSQYYINLADDWQCSESGYVNDIHTWVSFKGDIQFPIQTIHLAIWADDPVGNSGVMGEDPINNFSKPLGAQALWHYDLTDPSQWTMRPWAQGNQGWYDPRPEGEAIASDHLGVYQLNFLFDDMQAFWQDQGTIYWLEFSIQKPTELQTPGRIGWKESAEHFNDAAVWRDPGSTDWEALADPVTGDPMDMAFVITPEPSTLSMIALVSGCALFVRRRFIG